MSISNAELSFRALLKVGIPPVAVVVLCLTLLNTVLVLKQGIGQRPYLKIYLNLLITDLFVVAG